MNRRVALPFLAMGIAAALCAGAFAGETEENGRYKIGVPVYDLADEEVASFREYLEQYIGVAFEDVEFLYSQSIGSKEEELEFIQNCIDAGAKGIMAFNSYDLAAEVELCADHEVYYLRPAGTPSQEDFEKVSDNPYFLGYFGPGTEMEYQAGEEMASWFVQQSMGDEYFVLSGGASMGNAMHLERTKGILDGLQEQYQVTFDQPTEELAASPDAVHVEKGDLKVNICSGYIAMEPFFSTAKEAYEAMPSDIVLSVIPVAGMKDVIGDAKLGVIDCYTQQNSQLFNQGKLQYLCGKYSSIIGPAFAAMYNALTGYAQEFREDGHAFALTQGFWVADNEADFNEKFALSSGIALNAYSYQDILQVIKAYNPSAGYEDLQKLTQGWDFEAAWNRVNKTDSGLTE